MAATKVKLKQLENSATAGSIATTDSSNILTYAAPSAGVNHLWGYETGGDGTRYILIGTNLSYDTATNTLNASAGAGGYSDVQEDGAGFTNSNTNTKLNFVGTGLTAADAGSGITSITLNSFLNTLATAGTVGLGSGNVSGTLAVGNGGTGAVTLTGLLQGNGTSAVTAITNSSTVGQVLRVTGASTYGWGALDLSDTDAITGDLPFANLAQGSALSVLGVTGNATADNASIAASTDHQVLRRSGTALAFGAVNLAQSAAVTGILPITNGGTGSATQNFVDLSTTQTIGGAKTFSNNVTINGTPSANTDAATVGWVLNNVAGFRSGTVRAATDAIITATAQTSTTITIGGTSLTIDGQTMANGETVLVKNSVTGGSGGAFNNGVYTVSGIGSSVLLTRVGWMNTASEIDGVYVFVQDGTANVGTLWATTSEVTTLGVDTIAFTQLMTSGTIGGTAAANKVAYGSGTNTITTTPLFHFNGTQLAVGTATPTASATVTLKGIGTSSASNSLVLLDSADLQIFEFEDGGTFKLNDGTNVLSIAPASIFKTGASSLTITSSSTSSSSIYLRPGNSGSVAVSQLSGATSTNATLYVEGLTKSSTSSNQKLVSIDGTFSPSGAGTNTFSAIDIINTINQTTHTGVSMGINITPTITAAADYRGIYSNVSASHYSIYSDSGKIRLDLGSDGTGDILYRNASGDLAPLTATSNGYVLTLAAGLPVWAAPTGGTKTVGYVTGTGTGTYDLDSGTIVLDVDGAAFAFTVPADLDLVDVYRNGVMLSRSGSVPRDYTLNSGTGLLVLATSLESDETLKIVKRV